MGKLKAKRKSAPRPQPTGLPSVKDAEAEEEEVAMATKQEPIGNVITNILEKLTSSVAEERECGCATLGSLMSEPQATKQVLANGLVKVIAPLVLDISMSVRQMALGALRNLSVDGGANACEVMVNEDVMTPLISLVQQCGASWGTEVAMTTEARPSSSSSIIVDLQKEVFMQSIHLLWNLCENSEVAVSVFNRQKILPVLVKLLDFSKSGEDMAIVAGQCIHTVTDSNPEAVAYLTEQGCQTTLMALMSCDSMQCHMLLKILAAGILYNISGGDVALTSGAVVVSIIQLCGTVLQESATPVLQEIAQTLGEMTSSNEENTEPEAVSLPPKLESKLDDVQNLLRAQQLALEILTNLCCGEDDDEWEELESSDSGSVEDLQSADTEMADSAGASSQDALCVSTEVHGAFMAANIPTKALEKVSISPGMGVLSSLSIVHQGRKIASNVQLVEVRALLCLSNLVSSMDVEALGGEGALLTVWTQLSQLAADEQVLENADKLEATMNALRAIIQKLGEINSQKLNEVTESDVSFVFGLGRMCKVAEVRVSAVRIASTIGCILAKQPAPHPLLKPIGILLLEVACQDVDLHVQAEALDALFDVFAEDHVNAVIKDIKMLEQLKALAPVLKTKVQQQRKSLGEHYGIVNTAKVNLMRFIKYKLQHT